MNLKYMLILYQRCTYSELQSMWACTAFIAVRVFGLAVIVPLAEELFWRGFLLRWIIDEEFEKVSIGQYTFRSCVAVVLFNEQEEVLILFRNPHISQWMPGKWSLVGGHVEEGETAEEGMRRETKEETNLDLGSVGLVSVETIQMEGKDDLADIHFYATREFTGDVTLDYENDDFAWIAMEEIEQYGDEYIWKRV